MLVSAKLVRATRKAGPSHLQAASGDLLWSLLSHEKTARKSLNHRPTPPRRKSWEVFPESTVQILNIRVNILALCSQVGRQA